MVLRSGPRGASEVTTKLKLKRQVRCQVHTLITNVHHISTILSHRIHSSFPPHPQWRI